MNEFKSFSEAPICYLILLGPTVTVFICGFAIIGIMLWRHRKDFWEILKELIKRDDPD